MSSPGETGNPAESDPRARISPRALRVLLSLLALSLAANVAALVFFASKPSSTPTTPVTAQQKPTSSSAEGAQLAALQAALASGDPAQLAAAGCPPEVMKALAVLRAVDALRDATQKFDTRLSPGAKYWQPPVSVYSPDTARELRLGILRATSDLDHALVSVYGQDQSEMFPLFGSDDYAFLSPEKRERLRQIKRDYAELEAELEAAIKNNVRLPGDREQLTLLRQEKERDIAALLTPEDREQIELRTSQSAKRAQERFGRVLETEEDYKKVYALQRAFDDRFYSGGVEPTREWKESRAQAENALHDEIFALLSPPQLAALRQLHDHDREAAVDLAHRLALPVTTTDEVLALRDRTATFSAQVNADPSLSGTQRETRFQELAATSRAELVRLLGSQGARAYIEHTDWLSLLEKNQAFSTNPRDAPSRLESILTQVHPLARPANPSTATSPTAK